VTTYKLHTEQNVAVVEFDEVASLDTRKAQRTGRNIEHFAYHMHHLDPKWAGGTVVDTERVLRDGWPEGVALVNKLAEKLRGTLPKPKSYRRKQRWSDDGDEPSWEREQSGQTEIWRTSRREQQRGPAPVQLLAPWGGNAFLSAEQLRWDGVVLAVLCDVLEEAGYRVGATLVNAVRLPGQNLFGMSMMHVKQPQMPLDLASLVPVVAHPAVFRIHGINAISLAPWDCGMGHGSCIEIRALPAHVIPQGAVIMRHAYNEANAVREIQRVLALLVPDAQGGSYAQAS
jgi:hypothetical protein